EQKKFEFEGAGWIKTARGKRIDLALQRMAGVARHWVAVEVVHRQEHLPARRVSAVQWHQRAGDRPGPQVPIAGVPDQARLVNILADDIEAKDRDRQVAAVLINALQLVAAYDLPTADAIGIRQDDVK